MTAPVSGPARPLRVAHVIPYLGRAMGGPVLALTAMADATAKAGHRVTVGAVNHPSDGATAAFPSAVEVVHAVRSFGGNFRYSPELRRAMLGRTFDVAHSHGLWTYASRLADRLATAQDIPHVLAPCGMLQAGALRRSAWKKWICRRAFQDGVLRRASCLHAKSAAERESIRRFGLTTPVALIPNPISHAQAGPADAAAFRARLGLPDDAQLILYLGRLHPVKGLTRLVEAWAMLASRHPEWRLALAGPDEGGYEARLRELVSLRGCQESILFAGPMDDTGKWAAYAAADLFVMPSDFENFGLAIAEAMLAGLAVVTTTGTPWRDLRDLGCGWWVEPTVEALVETLDKAMALPTAERARRGAVCRGIVADMDPPRVAASCVAVYRWLLGQGERPAVVCLD